MSRMNFRYFEDGTVYWDKYGILIKLESLYYISNDMYCVARAISWEVIYAFSGDKNELIISLIDHLQKEYEKLNGR